MSNKDSKKIIRQNEDSYQTKTFRVLKNVSAKKYSFRVEERKCGHLLIGVQTLSLSYTNTHSHIHTHTHTRTHTHTQTHISRRYSQSSRASLAIGGGQRSPRRRVASMPRPHHAIDHGTSSARTVSAVQRISYICTAACTLRHVYVQCQLYNGFRTFALRHLHCGMCGCQ